MAESLQKKRIEYIDIAKGLGIIFVILGHCSVISFDLVRFIFTFHMPLFFILSGYTFSKKSCSKTGSFIAKNAGALLLPYAITAALIVIINGVQAWLGPESAVYESIKWAVSGLYGTGTSYLPIMDEMGIPITFIGVIWFLLALFFAKIILALALRSRTPLLWVTLSFFAGFVSAKKIGWFPFSIQAGMCAVLFLYIGYIIKEKKLFEWKSVNMILKLCMLLMWLYCVVYCGRIWMVSNTYTDGFLDIIGGVCGTFVVIYVSQLIEKIPLIHKLFAWLGRMSLGIMCGHVIVLDCIPVWDGVNFLAGHFGISYYASELIVQYVLAALVSLILYFIPWIGKKLFPNRRKN